MLSNLWLSLLCELVCPEFIATFRAGGHTRCEGVCAKETAGQAGGQGQRTMPHSLLSPSHSQNQLRNREQALKAALLNSYLLEPAGKFYRGSLSQRGSQPQKNGFMRYQPTLNKRSLTPQKDCCRGRSHSLHTAQKQQYLIKEAAVFISPV